MQSQSKHSGWVIALGAGLGAAFGVAAGHIGVWLAVGVAIGLALGMTMRGSTDKKESSCPECEALHRVHEARRQI